jgi:hypothetical protein
VTLLLRSQNINVKLALKWGLDEVVYKSYKILFFFYERKSFKILVTRYGQLKHYSMYVRKNLDIISV